MPDLAHAVILRLRPSAGQNPFPTLREISAAGRLAPVLGPLAPQRRALPDTSLLYVGPDLVVLFSPRRNSTDLTVTICRRQRSGLSPAEFTPVADALTRKLLGFLLAVLPVDSVFNKDRPDALARRARYVTDTPPPPPAPRHHRPEGPARPRSAVPQLDGLDTAPVPRSRPKQSWRAARAAVLALPMLLALAASSNIGHLPPFATPSESMIGASGLTHIQLTSAGPTEAPKDMAE